MHYTKLDENTKSAALLLDKHHLVLCLHEVLKLQEKRVKLIQLFSDLDEFLQQYNGDEKFKEAYSFKLQKNIAAKEKKLKFQASKVVTEFFNFKKESFFFNWDTTIGNMMFILCVL